MSTYLLDTRKESEYFSCIKSLISQKLCSIYYCYLHSIDVESVELAQGHTPTTWLREDSTQGWLTGTQVAFVNRKWLTEERVLSLDVALPVMSYITWFKFAYWIFKRFFFEEIRYLLSRCLFSNNNTNFSRKRWSELSPKQSKSTFHYSQVTSGSIILYSPSL